MNALKSRLAEGITILGQSRALRDHKESFNGEGLWRPEWKSSSYTRRGTVSRSRASRGGTPGGVVEIV